MRFHLFTGSCAAREAAKRLQDSVAYDPINGPQEIGAGTYGAWFDLPYATEEEARRLCDAVVRFGDLHTSKAWFRDYSHML